MPPAGSTYGGFLSDVRAHLHLCGRKARSRSANIQLRPTAEGSRCAFIPRMVVPGPNRCRLGRSCASYDLTWPHYPHVSALVLPSFKCVTFALFGGRHMRDPRVQQQGNVFSAPPEVGRAGAGPISPVLQLFIFVDLASSAFTSDRGIRDSTCRDLQRARDTRPPPAPPRPTRATQARVGCSGAGGFLMRSGHS